MDGALQKVGVNQNSVEADPAYRCSGNNRSDLVGRYALICDQSNHQNFGKYLVGRLSMAVFISSVCSQCANTHWLPPDSESAYSAFV